MLRNALFRRFAAGPVALALAIAACTEPGPTPPALRPADTASRTGGEVYASAVKVCKEGPAGTYHFKVTATGGNLFWSTFSLAAGTCEWFWEGPPGTPLTSITITEVDIPAGIEVGSIYVYTALGRDETLTGTNTVTLEVDGESSGKAVFTNVATTTPPPPPPPPPPPGSQGCTPGYWKQTQHFDSWTATGYAPGMLLGALFPGTSAYKLFKLPLSSYTLLDALNFPDDAQSSIDGAAQLLSRAAVAAVLNAAHPGVAYPRTVTEIVSAVNTALAAPTSRKTILSLQKSLDADNNLGCPLN